MPRAENRKKMPGKLGAEKQGNRNVHGGGGMGHLPGSQHAADKKALVEKMKRLQTGKNESSQTSESQE